MDNEQYSVNDLRTYWRALDDLQAGESIMVPSLWRMPRWQDICAQLNWQYSTIEGGYFGKKEYGFYGVYRLFAVMNEGGFSNPVTFNRVCGQDDTGTLYIGKAGSLSDRLNQLRRSLLRRERSHGVAEMLRCIRPNIPTQRLAVALLFTGRSFTGRSFTSVERTLIDAYINTFGDAPPLNYRR
jgi:hypothetical protein